RNGGVGHPNVTILAPHPVGVEALSPTRSSRGAPVSAVGAERAGRPCGGRRRPRLFLCALRAGGGRLGAAAALAQPAEARLEAAQALLGALDFLAQRRMARHPFDGLADLGIDTMLQLIEGALRRFQQL